jgi:hypothetical protein
MFTKPFCVKHYNSAQQRFLKPLIMAFFQRQFPKLFGPVIREKLADELVTLFHRYCPPTKTLKPGQVLWTALDKRTRGDSPQRKFVPVVLSLVTPDEVDALTKGMKPAVRARHAVARMFHEAYQQGGILSTRDVALLTLRGDAYVSAMRSRYEKEHDCILPHTGALHDMGSTITHKAAILQKVVLQKKSPARAARECNHSQLAVDRYLKDYHRVKTVYGHNQDITYIHHVTGIAKHVVKQYIDILQHEPS